MASVGDSSTPVASSSSSESRAKKPRRKQNPLLKWYTVIYNIIALLQWLFVFTQMFRGLARLFAKSQQTSNDESLSQQDWLQFVDDTAPLVWFVQSTQGLEFIHAILGIVKTSPIAALMQVCGRLLVWKLAVLSAKETSITRMSEDGMTFLTDSWLMFYIVTIGCWSVADITRYPLYIAKSLNVQSSLLNWLRYNLFIILYPIGTAGETGLWYLLHQSSVLNTEEWNSGVIWSMPNVLNFELSWQGLIRVCMILLSLGFFSLYQYMFAQRRKQLAKQGGLKQD